MHKAKVDYAYCAGLIDGEGCVIIIKSNPRKEKRQISPNYSLRLTVNMTSIECIKKLQGVFGGCFYDREREGTNFRSYNWTVTSKNAREVLKKILPFLKEKKEQALLGIAFQNMLERSNQNRLQYGRNRPLLNQQELEEREKFYLKMRLLKREKLILISTNRD